MPAPRYFTVPTVVSRYFDKTSSNLLNKRRVPTQPAKSFMTCTPYCVKRKYPIIKEEAEKLPVFQYSLSDQQDRRVYAWGLAEHGALGHVVPLKERKISRRYFPKPIRLHFAERFKVSDIACGYGFTAFAIKSNEKYKVFGCGINTDSQIGHQAPRRDHPLSLVLYPAPIEIPFQFPKTTHVKQLAAGRAHLLVLTDNEGVFSLGNNAYGQCGRRIIENEDFSSRCTVHNIPSIKGQRIKNIVCGQDHSLFLTETGQVFSCGWSADGQTGQGHYNNTWQLNDVCGDIKGEVITKVASSVDCVLALNEKGEVFGWGNSEYGQLMSDGNPQQNTAVFLKYCKSLGKIIDIAAGGSFCAIVNENGDVFVWGYGILGKGPEVSHLSEPSLIPATLFGRNEFQPQTRVISVAAGMSHIAAITNTGSVYTWGRNMGGCLGLGHSDIQCFPLQVSIGGYVKKVCCGVDHTVTMCQPFV